MNTAIATSWAKDIIRTELHPKWQEKFDLLCETYEKRIAELEKSLKDLRDTVNIE